MFKYSWNGERHINSIPLVIINVLSTQKLVACYTIVSAQVDGGTA